MKKKRIILKILDLKRRMRKTTMTREVREVQDPRNYGDLRSRLREFLKPQKNLEKI